MKHYLSKILDNIDVIVYVADFKTYEILYINEYTKNLFGNIEGKICWQSLQNRQDGPCSFCTNDRIITSEGKPTGVYHWEFQNTITGQWFDILDTAIEWKDGSFVRLEVATDITEHKKTEEALIESEKKYHSLVSHIPSVTWITDSDGKTIFISPNVEKIYGYTPDDIYNNAELWFERVHPENVKKVKEAYNKLFKKEGCFDIEYRIKRKDDKWIWLHDRAVTTYEKGGIQFAYGVFDDVTNRKHYEDSLKESNEHYHSLLDISPDAIVETGLDGKILYCNQQASKIHGYDSPAEMIGQDSLQSMFEEDIHIAQNNAALLLDKGYFKNITFRMRKKDGTPFPVEVSASLLKNAEGTPKSFIGYIRDITDRKKAESALKREMNLNKTLIESSPAFFAAIDADGKTLMMNKSMLKAIGCTLDEVVGKDYLTSFVPECDRKSLSDKFKIMVHQRKSVQVENNILTKDGRFLLVSWYGEPVYKHSGEFDYFFGYGTDITDRKKAEEAQVRLAAELTVKNKELEQLLYVTSHDLRSPLVNVHGYSKELDYSLKGLMSSLENLHVPSNMQEKITSIIKDDIPESLHYIQTSVLKMNVLLNGILTLSRLGRFEMSQAEIDMNEMMNDIANNHQFRLKALRIKTEISNLPNCKGDSSQVNQVFSNLIDNAIKYSDSERSSVIKISGYKDKNQSVYCIADNGIGIALEHQDKIFEIFHQLEPYRIKGEGMGLTIAHRIIERHKGRIWIESELGRGSKFCVSLPS